MSATVATGIGAELSGWRIANGWLTPEPALDREGFAITRHETAVQGFEDEADIEAVYYPEMERLLREATGASRVLVFDHMSGATTPATCSAPTDPLVAPD